MSVANLFSPKCVVFLLVSVLLLEQVFVCLLPQMSSSERCTCELRVIQIAVAIPTHGICGVGSRRERSGRQWLPQYPLILTGGFCSAVSVVQQILRNSTTVATVSSLLHMVLAYLPSESFLFAVRFSCPDSSCYQVAS